MLINIWPWIYDSKARSFIKSSNFLLIIPLHLVFCFKLNDTIPVFIWKRLWKLVGYIFRLYKKHVICKLLESTIKQMQLEIFFIIWQNDQNSTNILILLRNNHLFIQNFDLFLLSITTITTAKAIVAADILQRFIFVLSRLGRVIFIKVRIILVRVRVVRVRVKVRV